jgi:hypothetical protein
MGCVYYTMVFEVSVEGWVVGNEWIHVYRIDGDSEAADFIGLNGNCD